MSDAVPPTRLRLIGAVLIVAAVAAGYSGKRYLDRAPRIQPIAEQLPPAAVPDPQTQAPVLASKPVPETLPGFALKDRDGKPRRLADWKGQPLLVNYWATWCPPCRREIPLLNRLRVANAAHKVEVIGIAVDFRADVLAYAAKQKIEYPLLIGEEDGLEAVAAVGMEPAFPFTVFADRRQRIVAVKIGELHEDEAQLILAAIERVDAGGLELSAARTQISEGLKQLATKRALTGDRAPAETPSG
jgi:thiol-disulfide isomerase/thioredoxin